MFTQRVRAASEEKRIWRNSLLASVACLGCAAALLVVPAKAQDPIPPPTLPNVATPQSGATLNVTMRAKASPDECFLEVGQNVRYDLINQTTPATPCGTTGKYPKVNQGYVWGSITVVNAAGQTEIWFGTEPNGQCITQGGVTQDASRLTAYKVPNVWACEFYDSPYSTNKGGPLPAGIGDFRPARIYIYNTVTKAIQDITPKSPAGTQTCNPTTAPLCLDPLFQQTRGVRNAAQFGQYIVMGGPALSTAGALNWFAYDTVAKKWIAKMQLPNYDNTRRFYNFDGVQYTAVGKSGNVGGAVLRLATNFTTIPAPPAPGVIPSCAACFIFTKVADLDGEGAYITALNGRLYVTTWPQPGLAGLYMSPVVPTGGLTAANAAQWTKVWQADQYEPDPVIVSSYAGGALMGWNGYVYWGTMNVPWGSTGRWTQVYGIPTDPAQQQEVIKDSFRTAIVLRGRNFDTGTPDIDVLYGAPSLWKYTPGANNTYGTWALVPNKMPAGKQIPLYGASGFGQPYTNYIWTMNIFQNKLWVGTMDWSYMAAQSANIVTFPATPTATASFFPGALVKSKGALPQADSTSTWGGDLYTFSSTSQPATAETVNNFGNYTSYGFRNIYPVGTDVWLGTANPMNLATPGNPGVPAGFPLGGWEILQGTPKTSTPRPVVR